MNWAQLQRFLAIASGVLLLAGALGIIVGGLKPAVEFTGGAALVLEASQSAELASIETIAQTIQPDAHAIINGSRVSFELPPLDLAAKNAFVASLSAQLATELTEQSFQTVGPSVGRDLLRKTVFGMALAMALLLIYLWRQFRNWRFGVAAVLAMVHDLGIVTGSFAWLGYLFGARLDILFVTAILTTLSFSVHDTIVMFDRLRELQRERGGRIPLPELARQAVLQTLTRSLNNSLTIVFMLLALILLGGESIRWFLIALLIGTVSGTYSSPFVAVPLYVWLEQHRGSGVKK